MISIHLLHCSNRSGNFKASQEKTFTELWLGKDCFEKWIEFLSLHNQFWVLQKWKRDEKCLFFRKHLLTLVLQSSSAGAVGFWGLHGQWHGRGIPELSMTAIQTAPLRFLPAVPLELRAWALLLKLRSRSLHLYLFSYLHFPPTKSSESIEEHMFFVCSNHLHVFTFFEFWCLVGTPTNGVTKLPLRLKRQDHDAEQRSPLRAAQLFSGPSAWWTPFNTVEGYRDMLRLRMEDIFHYETTQKYENIDMARQSIAIYGNPWQSAMWVNGIFSKMPIDGVTWPARHGTWRRVRLTGDTWHLLLTETRYWDIQILGFS